MANPKRSVLLVTSAGALISLAAWTQTWFVFSTSEGIAMADVTVAGTESRPLISALALGSLAAVGALLLAGPVARILILITTFVVGVAGIASVITALTNPVAASLSSLSQIMGVADVAAVSQSVSGATFTLWSWATALGFALICLAVVFGLISTREWSRPTQRFNRPEIETVSSHARTPNSSEGDSWDTLSRGEDPTR